MSMKLGLHGIPQNTSYDDLKRLWHLTDSSGFDWISVTDHFYPNPTVDGSGDCFEGMTTLAALAIETTNVRVASMVFCIGYRSPAILAKAALSIDHMSHGRLELGLGAGWDEMEARAYGIPLPSVKTRMDMLEEGVQIIKSMLTEGVATFQGEHYKVDKAFCHPLPIQKKPRLWIGGKGEKRILRIAARYADGWNIAYVSPEVFSAKGRVLEQWCEVEDRDPAQIQRSVNVGFFMGADEASAQRKREEFENAWGEKADQSRDGMIFGTYREVIDRIGAYGDAGAPALNIALRAPYDFDAYQSFIENVIPAFKN